MKVVAENSEEDLARNRAAEVVGWALRELAANLLRVVRGVGRPNDLGRQAVTFVDTLQTYRGTVGEYPSSRDLAAMVALDGHRSGDWSDEACSRRETERSIVRGALQIAASELLDQLPQRAAGETELYAGVTRAIDQRKAPPRKRTVEAAKSAAATTLAPARPAVRQKPRPAKVT